MYFDETTLDDSDPFNVVVKSLIQKQIGYDMVILHSTPDLWPDLWRSKHQLLKEKMVIGYCTWETDVLPTTWSKCINECVHELWVPSSYNKENFIKSGVTVPITVVPHIFLNVVLPAKNTVNLNDDTIYTFYTIGELNPRKNILETIEAFCKAFNKDDQVRLIVKTHYKSYDIEDKSHCKHRINEELDKYPNHAPVILLTEPQTQKQINALHSIGDCYVSLTRSEGFGMPIFDAHNYGKQVICTGYSGPLDFLGKSHPGLVNYELGDVFGMKNFAGHSEQNPNQHWANPDVGHAAELMRKVYEASL